MLGFMSNSKRFSVLYLDNDFVDFEAVCLVLDKGKKKYSE